MQVDMRLWATTLNEILVFSPSRPKLPVGGSSVALCGNCCVLALLVDPWTYMGVRAVYGKRMPDYLTICS